MFLNGQNNTTIVNKPHKLINGEINSTKIHPEKITINFILK